MSVLLTESNQEIREPKQILYKQKQFYQKLYAYEQIDEFPYKNNSNVTISEDMKDSLEGQFRVEELRNAIQKMGRNKTPGIDGLTTEFYIVFMPKFESLLLNAMNYAFTTSGKIHDSAMRGIITLLPKSNKDTRKLTNLRPITILPTDYKLVEKILANRLKPVLDKLIHNYQKGFMANRRISCNIRRILDIIDMTETDNLPAMIVSIDFLKCFDRIATAAIMSAMDYFGIGPEFKRWTSMIYTNSKACVINYEYFSPYFKINRGVKQGGPCSAYYFLLIAEVLAIELRSNPNIKGIIFDEIAKILGLYADDIDLYLYGEQKSLDAALNTIERFNMCTGFKINYDKTTIYRISSLRESNASFYTSQQVNWNSEYINVLGVNISHRKDDLMWLNYGQMIPKIKSTLLNWTKRGLSLSAKVMVINTLIASLFTYKMSVLPAIDSNFVKKVTGLLNQFLWNNNKPKIKIQDLEQNRYEGGLGLVNLINKDKSLKISWIKIIDTDDLLSVTAYNTLSRTLKHDIWLCNLKVKDVSLIVKKGFWSQVLEAWSEINFLVPTNTQEVQEQFIWYNSFIKIQTKPILYQQGYHSGLRQIKQLCQENRKLLSVHVIARTYKLTIMQCNSLLNAIPKEWKDMLQEQMQGIANYKNLYEIILCQTKPTSWAYKILIQRSSRTRMLQIYQRWVRHEVLFEYEEFIQAFRNMYLITNQLKLRSFHYRILYKAIILNDKLYTWKIKSTNTCSSCPQKIENIKHFLWDCKQTQKLYQWIREWCNKVDPGEQLQINFSNVILNNIHENPGHIFNFVLLLGKQYLYVKRCKVEPINKTELYAKIETTQRLEMYEAIVKNKVNQHIKKWCLCKKNEMIYNGSGFENQYVNTIIGHDSHNNLN